MGRDSSSQVGPEVLRVLFLPVIPDFVNHLGKTPNFSLSSSVGDNEELQSYRVMHHEQGI